MKHQVRKRESTVDKGEFVLFESFKSVGSSTCLLCRSSVECLEETSSATTRISTKYVVIQLMTEICWLVGEVNEKKSQKVLATTV